MFQTLQSIINEVIKLFYEQIYVKNDYFPV